MGNGDRCNLLSTNKKLRKYFYGSVRINIDAITDVSIKSLIKLGKVSNPNNLAGCTSLIDLHYFPPPRIINNDVIFPETLRVLKYDVNESIKYLPPNLIVLTLGWNFNSSIKYFPPKLKTLKFGAHHDTDIPQLPPNLKTLIFGFHYNQPTILNSSVEFVEFGKMFNGVVECGGDPNKNLVIQIPKSHSNKISPNLQKFIYTYS